MKKNQPHPARKHRGIPFETLEQAAKDGTFYRQTPDEWAVQLKVSRQRFHQIRELLELPTHRTVMHKAHARRLPWKDRAAALWQLGVYDPRGGCWTQHVHCETFFTGDAWRKRRSLFRLRYGRIAAGTGFDLPTCGKSWCINPEHQKPVSTSVLQHRRALPRAERVARALEAGESYKEIARREGVSASWVSRVNTGVSVRGVRAKYPIHGTRLTPGPK